MIPYGRQNISEKDIQAVVDVLRSDFLTQGPVVPKFEQAVSEYSNVKYAIAVNSGTSALHIACLALGLTKGDWLWTTPISFVASANCGLYCAAQVDFVDIDPLTWNLSTEKLKEKLVQAKHEGRLPKVLVAVHLCGLSCDMEEIHVLSQEYGFRVVEDACHAIGGKYQNEPIGNCRYSDITVFSFHPVKTITTGEGGMAVTNDKRLAKKMELLRSHGITHDPDLMTHSPDGTWYYQQIELGYNYRLTDIQAALGLNQLLRLDNFIDARNKIADQYNKKLSGLPLQFSYCSSEKHSACHLYVIRVDTNECNRKHKDVFDFLRQKGIGVNIHYIPIHTQPYFQSLGFGEGDFPEAEAYYDQAITLPIFPELTMDMQDNVISSVIEVLG